MRIALWHVHGSWTTAFVQGGHEYLVPVTPDRGPYGLGRARTWEWPPTVVECSPEQLAAADIDVVVLQRPEELHVLAHRFTGRRPGIDVPAVYLEHNAPDGPAATTMHPAAGHRGLTIVHVTWFNRLMWDTGPAPVRVVEHGIVDPGARYTGEVEAAAAVINEPLRRGRITGTDLVVELARQVPVDLFGMGTAPLGGAELPQAALHRELARRRLYLHCTRWTSLGLSLVEAMHLGMPVVALGTTEVPTTVPAEAGVVTTRPDELAAAVRTLLGDPDRGRAMGAAARRHALVAHGLDRFLQDWDTVLKEVAA